MCLVMVCGSVFVRGIGESKSVTWRCERESLSVWGCELLRVGMKYVSECRRMCEPVRRRIVRCGISRVPRVCSLAPGELCKKLVTIFL